jgi:hypothetical protein
VCSKKKGMPQDIRVSPDGKRYYIADMDADGVHIVDAALHQGRLHPDRRGAHGLYPSRDGTKLYVANRGTHKIHGKPKGKGSVTVIDFATEKVVAQWPIPAAAARTWATSAPTASICGCPAALTMWCTASTPATATSRKSRSARSRTA